MLDLTQLLIQSFASLISGLVINIVWIILIIWGIKVIARELREGIKKIPSWIGQYEEIKQHQRTIDKALGDRT